jgi:hypothetical protein
VPIDTTTQLTPERLMQFTFSFAPPLIIEAGIRHRVFNVPDEGAKTIALKQARPAEACVRY